MPRAPRHARRSLAWGRIEPVRFGPITQKQRLERLLFYPDPHAIAAKQIAKLLAKGDAADIEPDKLAGASVAVQGFGAVDAVLYGKGAESLADGRHPKRRSAAAMCTLWPSTSRRSPRRRTPHGPAISSRRGSPRAAATRHI